MTATQATAPESGRSGRNHVAHLEYASRKAPVLGPDSGIRTREQADEVIRRILGRKGSSNGNGR